MTTYQSGVAFRRALEDRLVNQSAKTQTPLIRLRKLVAFDRFLARLFHADPNIWVLKGGLSLQLRLGHRARTTKDIDLLSLSAPVAVAQALTSAALLDLQDWFAFSVRASSTPLPGPGQGGLRFFVTASVGGRLFERFHIDVGIGDPVIEPVDRLTMPPLLAFAGIPPSTIPCFPLSQHLAEKVHAYIRPRPAGENTRVRDLVDILLIAEHMTVSSSSLSAALRATFAAQGVDAPPKSLPAPPQSWSVPYRSLATEVGLSYPSLSEAGQAAQRFLDPVLSDMAQGSWSPVSQMWE